MKDQELVLEMKQVMTTKVQISLEWMKHLFVIFRGETIQESSLY